MKYNEVEGNLITLAKEGNFDVIAHGCNCFCTMGAGLAPQMANAFGCDIFDKEAPEYKGDINKLGTIDYSIVNLNNGEGELPSTNILTEISVLENDELIVVNCYSQYGFGSNHKEGSVAPIDYEALQLCFRKMNHQFKDKYIGLPQIGCHLAGGDWNVIKEMIQKEFKDCDVTVVIYKP